MLNNTSTATSQKVYQLVFRIRSVKFFVCQGKEIVMREKFPHNFYYGIKYLGRYRITLKIFALRWTVCQDNNLASIRQI